MIFPHFGLDGKVAVVTGASRGIGRAIACAVANAGADVVITARDEALLNETAEQIGRLGRKVIAFTFDINDVDASRNMVDEVVSKLGKIDILVNNAGNTDPAVTAGPAEELTPEKWDAVMNTNLRGLFFCTTVVGKHMKGNRRGKIVNLGSAAGLRGLPHRASYGASKGGVVQLTRMLAVEWAPFGINVNCICPYFTMSEGMRKRLADPAELQEVVRTVPMGRVAEPEDIAGAAVFFSSTASDFVTGQILAVDGGRAAAV